MLLFPTSKSYFILYTKGHLHPLSSYAKVNSSLWQLPLREIVRLAWCPPPLYIGDNGEKLLKEKNIHENQTIYYFCLPPKTAKLQKLCWYFWLISTIVLFYGILLRTEIASLQKCTFEHILDTFSYYAYCHNSKEYSKYIIIVKLWRLFCKNAEILADFTIFGEKLP